MGDYTWNPLLLSGSWGVAANWIDEGEPPNTPGYPTSITTPGVADYVLITNAPTITGTGEAAVLTLDSALDLEGTFVFGAIDEEFNAAQGYQIIYVGNGIGASSTLSLTGYSSTDNEMIVGNSGGTGTLNIDGATLEVAQIADEYFAAGDGQNSSGTVNVSGSQASLSANYAYFGYDGGNATINILSGSEVATEYGVYVGEAGGNAQILVDGVGSKLRVDDDGLVLGAPASANTSAGSGTLDVTNGGEASIFASVTLSGNSSISLDATGEVEVGGSGNVIAGTIVIDTGYSISGNGLVDGPVENNGQIIANGGTLILTETVTGTGTMTVDDNADLSLAESVASTQIVEFATSTDYIARTLEIGNISKFSAEVVSFQSGDTVDLDNVIANDAVFDPNTGILQLYNETWGTGDDATLVGTLDFTGISSSTSYALTTSTSFALASDGNGGTDITFGTPTPSVQTLAGLADAVYSPGIGLGGYSVVDQSSDSSVGFFAEEFQDGNQIVVAIEGTDPDLLSAHGILTLLADKSWLGSTPTATLATQVADAADFLENIRLSENNPLNQYVNITLTGHSLGGAIAQLLGSESDYEAVGFNAPGSQQFFDALSTQLQPAFDVSDGISRINNNYRLYGDQVSLFGAPIGTQFTIASPFPDAWLDALNNHKMDNLDSQLEAGASIVTADAPLPLSDLATEAPLLTSAGQAIYTVNLLISAIAHYYGFDPTGNGTYTLTESSPSPAFSSILLPAATGVATYSVSFLQDGSWSAGEDIAPGMTLSVPSGDPVTGISFTPEDSSQNTVALPDGLIFEAAFASTGNFDGTLTETLACFFPGTRIATPSGEIPIQELAIGNVVLAQNAGVVPIKWIGHRRVDCRNHPKPLKVWPVCVHAGAFGDGRPHRDLWLSPDHAVFVDGVLIPIKRLINATTIEQVRMDEVTYYHVELPQHDVLLAEGLPAESYLDIGDRFNFENSDDPMALHPEFSAHRWDTALIWEALGCARLIVTGPQLETVRQRTNSRGAASRAA